MIYVVYRKIQPSTNLESILFSLHKAWLLLLLCVCVCVVCIWCESVCVCCIHDTCVLVYSHVHICVEIRDKYIVCLNLLFIFFFFDTNSLTEPEDKQLPRLTSQWAMGILLSHSTYGWGFRQLLSFYGDARDLHSAPYARVESILITKASLHLLLAFSIENFATI